MPHLLIRKALLNYTITGTGPETIVFVHGLMLASPSWHHQVAHLSQTYRVITFDLRGQGASEKTRDGLDLDSLAEDTAALIVALAPQGAHLAGFSMGSFVAMRVAARHPDLVRTLTLIGPSGEAEAPENRWRYPALIGLVSVFGPRVAIGPMMKILFGDSFRSDPAQTPVLDHWRGYLRALPRSLARAADASAKRGAIMDELATITAPTLVISGSEDRPISPAHARRVAGSIPGAVFLPVAGAGHAVMLERPDLVNAALSAHLVPRNPVAA
jgi:pimeloyl-ACP methyl ester carboxylesterase